MTLLAIIVLLGCIIICYWIWFFIAFRLIITPALHDEDHYPPVSVIICYKNEANHIVKTVQAILDQDYPNFELIAIDDFSTDGGPSLLSRINDDRLKSIKASEHRPGKKVALTEAISRAKYDLLLFTDADCIPATNLWMQSMVQSISQNPDHSIVLGYGPLYKTTSWVNAFSRYETTLTAILYMAFSASGLTYMGVGRNLMYRKDLFYDQNGFNQHLNVASGDDDLMISQAAKSSNVAIQLHKNSFVYSYSKESIASYLTQKSRHISTSIYYRPLVKFLLAGFAAVQLLFYLIIGIGLMIGEMTFALALLLLVSKWLLQMISQYSIFKRLSSIKLLYWFPVFDILMMMYYLYLPIFKFFNQKEW